MQSFWFLRHFIGPKAKKLRAIIPKWEKVELNTDYFAQGSHY